jgi:hypothetical protein
MLRLRHLAPSGFLCFVFLEGAVALGLLLALAELVSWWGVLVLPTLVALMVKLNDVIAGSLARTAQSASAARAGLTDPAASRSALRPAAAAGPVGAMPIAEVGTKRLPGVIDRGHGTPIKRPWAERVEAQEQWLRQSATRRYE